MVNRGSWWLLQAFDFAMGSVNVLSVQTPLVALSLHKPPCITGKDKSALGPQMQMVTGQQTGVPVVRLCEIAVNLSEKLKEDGDLRARKIHVRDAIYSANSTRRRIWFQTNMRLYFQLPLHNT
jgi:hypothetical protein